MEKEFANYSNDALFKMMKVLNENHEKIKLEIMVLVEMMNGIHADYVAINEELKYRT